MCLNSGTCIVFSGKCLHGSMKNSDLFLTRCSYSKNRKCAIQWLLLLLLFLLLLLSLLLSSHSFIHSSFSFFFFNLVNSTRVNSFTCSCVTYFCRFSFLFSIDKDVWGKGHKQEDERKDEWKTWMRGMSSWALCTSGRGISPPFHNPTQVRLFSLFDLKPNPRA